MDADPALAFGQIATTLTKVELAHVFAGEGIPAEATEHVVRCQIGADRVEWQATKGGYMLNGDRDWSRANCERLSAALSARRVRHRIELYSDDETLIGYLHHGWPQKDA